MELKFVNSEIYEKDITSFGQRNFLQSSYEGEKMKHDGWKIFYVEGIENQQIEVIGLLGLLPLAKFFTYAYIPRGLLYKDIHQLSSFIKLLKPFLKSKKCMYLETDPYILLQQRDKNGDIVTDGISNQETIRYYQQLGFIHLPLKQGYDMTKQCRFMSVLDLKNKSEQDIFQSFIPKTRNNIKNTIKNNLKIRVLNKDELYILTDIVQMSSVKQHFEALPLRYYEEQYEFFKEHAKAYYVYLDVQEYSKQIQDEIIKEKKKIEECNTNLIQNPYSKNSKNRLKIATSNLQALYKREKQAKDIIKQYPKELPLAAAMYITYGKEKIYLMSGSNDTYKSFKGPYALQWHMIQQTIKEHLDYYNFYGISGLFKPQEEGYGVFDFKRSFNAEVVELIGNFIYPVSPFFFKLYNKIKHII